MYSVNNQMKLAVRQLVAKLTRSVPDFSVAPASGDQDEIQGALAATDWCHWFKHKEDWEVKYLMAMIDVAEIGVGFHEVLWNPLSGRRMAMCERCQYVEESIENLGQPCPACVQENELQQQQFQVEMQDEMAAAQILGQPVAPPPQPQLQDPGTLEEFYEGDLELHYRNPRDILPEAGCASMRDCRYWFTQHIRPVAELRADYPEVAQYINPESGLFYNNNLKVSYSPRNGQYTHEEYFEHGLETIYTEIPSIAYPTGRRIVIINNKILAHIGPNPYHFLNRPNIFVYNWDKDNDSFWSQPFGEHAWHRQKELNENEIQQREESELMARTKVLVPRNSGISSEDIEARGGQVIHYNPAVGKPEYMRKPEMTQDIFQRGGRLAQDIMAHATISAAEQGIMSGDTSGRALAIVQAEADQQIGPTNKFNYGEAADLMKCAIMIFRKNAPIDRQYYVVGDQGLQVYTLADLNIAEAIDLRVEPEDGFSKNQQLRLQSMYELFDRGLFSNPATGMPDIPRFVKAAKLKIPGIGGDKTTSQKTHAHYLLRMIEKGQPVQPMPWDDPVSHADTFLDWLQSKGYNPKTNPEVTQRVYEMFVYYMQFAQMSAMGQPPPEVPQSAQGPGGPQQPQSQGAQSPREGMGPGGNIRQDAQSTVSQADRVAEGQARARTQPHEG
jgi:hypothetical protein